MLPKVHPVYKTYLEIRRCAARIDDYIAQFPEDRVNDTELYVRISAKLYELLEEIPQEYK